MSRLRFLSKNYWKPEWVSAIKPDSVYGSNDFDQFLVKWLGHDRSTATWETRFAIRRIQGGSEAIQQYEQPGTTSHTTSNESYPKSISKPTQSPTQSPTQYSTQPQSQSSTQTPTQSDRVSTFQSQPYHRANAMVNSRRGTDMPAPSPKSPGVLSQNMETSNQAASTITAMPQRVKKGSTIQPIDTALQQIFASHETRHLAPTQINVGHGLDSTNTNNNNTTNNDNESSNKLIRLRNKNNNLLEYTHIPAESQPTKPRLLQPRLRPVSIMYF